MRVEFFPNCANICLNKAKTLIYPFGSSLKLRYASRQFITRRWLIRT